jgi:NADH dehydrogenase FAD-containing subunit
MFALRTRLAPLCTRGFATAASEAKPATDKAYKVVVVGGGPGGLSGMGFVFFIFFGLYKPVLHRR